MALTMKLLLAFLLPLVAALKFDMPAHPGHESTRHERCIRNFVAKEQLVVVTVNAGGFRGDGQTLNLHVCGIISNLLSATRQAQVFPLLLSGGGASTEDILANMHISSLDQGRPSQRVPPSSRRRRRGSLRFHLPP